MSGDDGDDLGGADGGGGSKGGSDVDGTNGREYAGLNQEGDANEQGTSSSSRHAAIRVSTPPLEQRKINRGGTTAEGPGKGKQKIPGGDNKQPQQTILNKKQKRGKYTHDARGKGMIQSGM